MSDFESKYLDVLKNCLDTGVTTKDRTGVGTLSLFGVHLDHDLSKGFPAFTTRKLAFKTMFHELIWMLKGNSNIKYLQDNGVKIWDSWADSEGNLGASYPTMWRKFPDYNGETIDQIGNVIQSLKENIFSRRHIVCAWNPALVNKTVLPPCHSMFIFYADDGKLNCHLTQRSGDLPAGIFFNIPSYSLLTHIIAQIVGLPVGRFSHTIVNAHIYLNQVEGVKKLLERTPLELPQIWVNPNLTNIDDITIEDAKLINYNFCTPQINFPVAV